MARNELFQKLAARICALAVDINDAAVLPSAALATGAGDAAALRAAPTGVPASDPAAVVKAVGGMQLPGGDTLGKPASVSAVVTDHVGKIGENLVLRTITRMAVPGGIIAPYLHNVIAPGLGSIGVVVGLRAVGAKGGAVHSLAGAPEATRAAVAEVGRKLAMHVAASRPAFLTRGHVDTAALDRERDVLLAQAAATGKPKEIVAKMVEGKLGKYYTENCLLEQPFVAAEDGAKVSKWLAEASKKVAGLPEGATLEVAGYLRVGLGEAAAAAEAAAQSAAAAAGGAGTA